MKKYSHISTLIKTTVLFVVFSISGCSVSTKEPVAEDKHEHEAEETIVHLNKEQLERSKIIFSTPEYRSIGSEIKVNGMIDVPPQNHVSVNMPYGGFLKKITVLPGSQVKKGQLLAVISNPEFIQFQQDYLEALGKQDYLKGELERQQTLNAEEVSSNKVLQQAKSEYLINDATIKSNEERLKLIGFNTASVKEGNISSTVSLYSPISGSVRDVLTNVGKYINPQDVIMNLTNTDDLHVELRVYENDVDKIFVGQTILFSVANSLDQWREAEVFLVGSDVREDRSVTVHGHLKGKQADLLPGMYVSARLKVGNRNVMTLPEEAFIRHKGKVYVFKVINEDENPEEYQLEMIEVEEGVSSNDMSELKLGKENLKTKFVSQGTFYLLSALKNSEDDHQH